MEMSLSRRDGGRHPVPNMETLTMSRHERERMTIMAGVKREELTQVQAAQLLGLGYRQTKRVWRRYQAEGDAGLVHRLRGQPGLRRKPPAVRIQVLPVPPRNAMRTSVRRCWPRNWRRRGSAWITTPCGGGCWRRANALCGGAGKSIGNGGSASRTLGQWCNWTGRIMTGLRGGVGSVC